MAQPIQNLTRILMLNPAEGYSGTESGIKFVILITILLKIKTLNRKLSLQ
jgi:hypothetical protein